MDLNFFKQTRILDGGMGQELLARGMEPNGTLWSANALIQEKYHQLLLDTHVDFIKAGAEVIGIGAWLGTIMLFNVWGLIWPNQKRILGMVKATDEQIAKGKVVALMASRTNTLLSIPMLMCMSSHMHGLPL